jgi:Winged helix DNA-binding domain
LAGPSSAPVLTRRVLNRTLLARQGLLERTARDPLEVVTTLVGMQAQEPIDPYVGLWARIADFDPLLVSEAIETRRLVRMGSFRTTLHLLTTEDALAVAPLTAGVHRRTFANTPFAKALVGVPPEDVIAEARTALAARPMSPSELGRHLAERWPDRDQASLAYVARYSLSLVQVPPRGLWERRGRTTNTTLEAWTGRTPAATTVDALVLRYLRAFGPATTADMRTWSWFTGLREVVERLRPSLRAFRDEAGRELLDVEDGIVADPDLPAPVRFLPQYDNVFLSHDDRSRINGALSWGLAFVRKGTLLVDGGIAGAWRVGREGTSATMTVELGRALSSAERRDLEAEAERLGAFLDPEARRDLVILEPG